MKAVLVSIWFCIGAIPALAQHAHHISGGDHHAAPALLAGVGVPAVLAVGGVLLVARFLARGRKHLRKK